MRGRKATSCFLIKPQSVCMLVSTMILVALILFAQAHESKVNSNTSGNMLAPVQGIRNAPVLANFTISASPTMVTVLAGDAGTSTINVTSQGVFSQPVSLTVTITPAGLSCTVTPNLVTPPQGRSITATLSCSGSANTYTVTVTGTSTAFVPETAKVTYTVQDFTLVANPTSVTVLAGASGTSTIIVTNLQGFAGVVSLSSSISPAIGITCTLAPTSITGSGTSILSCSGSAGTYTLTITGTSGSLLRSATFTVTVTDFTLVGSSPPPIIVTTIATSTITLTAINGFTGTVSLTSSVQAGLTCGDLSPGSVTLPPSPVTATIACSSTIAGTYTVTITGTSRTLSRAATITFNVQDFTITASDPSPANLGSPVSSAITVIGQNGFKDSVNLIVTVPIGLSCGLTPNSVTPLESPGSNLSCTSTTAGSFSVTVFGSSGQVSHSKPVTVTFGDYTITANPPAVNVQSGGKSASIITLVNNGYNGRVILSLTSPVITGLSFALDTPVLNLVVGQSPTATLTVSTTASTPAGDYPVSIVSNSLVPRGITVTVTVGGNFTMTLGKSQMVVVEGASANTTVTLSSFGISGVVTLYAIPPVNSGVHGRFNPPLVQLTAGLASSTALTIDASTVVFPGVYNVTLVGEGGSVRRLIYLNLTVSDFSIMINPNPISIPPGQVSNTTVYVHGLFSFNGTVNLVTYPLRQIQPSLAQNSLVLNSTSPLLNSTLTIRVQGSTLPGVYYIRLTGTVGRLVHTVILKLSVVEFSINTSPSIILQVGQPLPTTLTIISQNGFAGTVDLNFTVPRESGLTGQISPSSVGLLSNTTSSATLTLTASRPGVYRMNVTGTSEIAHSFQYVTVYVGDFSVSSSSPSIVVIVGTTKTFQVNLASNFLFSGTITLSTICDPPSLDISNLGNATVASTRTTTIVITVSGTRGTPGVYNVTVVGTNGSLSHSVSVRVLVVYPPLLTVPGVETVNQGSLLTFSVTAADSDPTLTISYNTLPPGATIPSPGLPPGATFYPSYRTNSTMTILTGIFDWKPSSNQMPGDYVITFTVQDRNGGVTSRQVTLHVNSAGSRSPIIPSSPLVWYSLIAVIGIAGTLVGSRIWRNRNLRAVSHDEDTSRDLEI